MRFDVGLLDRLFGEKLDIEVPSGDGEVVKRQVSAKWLKKMQRDGRINQVRSVSAHILDPLRGYYVTEWVVGRDVQESTVDRFAEPSSGCIYVLCIYRDGVPETYVTEKTMWLQARATICGISSGSDTVGGVRYWDCPECGQPNPEGVKRCWKCSAGL